MNSFIHQYSFMCPPYRQAYYPPMCYPEQQFQEQTNNDSTYKAEVTQWLQLQTQEDLLKIFQINGQYKTFPILKMYIYNKLYNHSNYALKQETKIDLEQKIEDQFTLKSKNQAHRAEELFDQLVITDNEDFMDSIQVKELTNLTQFLGLLEDLSDKNLFSSQPKVTLQKIENPIWFHQNSFQSCEKWIINEFEKNIAQKYSKQRDKKKKLKSPIQATINIQNNQDLKEYYLKHYSCNKDKLIELYNSSVQEIEANSSALENKFFKQIFESAAMKIKIQNDQQHQFVHKCISDQQILNTMIFCKFSDLLEQKTYYLKKSIKLITQNFKSYLETQLINEEISKKKDKKKKKKKSLSKSVFKKELDPIELQQRLSSQNLSENNIISRFVSRSFSHNNLQYTTPPNTPSEYEFSEEYRQGLNQLSQLSPMKPMIEIEMKEIKSKVFSYPQQFQDFNNNFKPTTDIDQNQYQELSQSITISIINKVINQVSEEQFYNQTILKQQRKLRKKLRNQQKSNKQLSQSESQQEDDLQLISPQSEITHQSQESQAHTYAPTASTSEEEQIKPHTFTKTTRITKFQSKNKKRQKQQQEIKLERSSIKRDVIDNFEQISEKTVEQQVQQDIEMKIMSNSLNFSPISEESIEKPKFLQENIVEIQDYKIQQKQEEQPIEYGEKTRNEAKQQMIHQLNKDINDYTDEILKDYDDMLYFRQIAFERIQFVVQSNLFSPLAPIANIRLYGSCVTGLALLDSDIDIGVVGFELWNKQQQQQPFDHLYYALSKKKCVTKLKSIVKTHIPIIKLEIDPIIPFNEYDEQGYLNVREEQKEKWVKLRSRLNSAIKIDISFHSFDQYHLGFATTDMVTQWMKEYQIIQQLVLILKSLVKKMGLSEAFTGGLSSYAIIIMVYSYLQQNYDSNKNCGEIFLELLDFYGNHFNTKETGIGVMQHNTLYFNLKDYPLPELPIVIFNPYNQKLLSSGFIHIQKILKQFSKIVNETNSLTEFYCQFLQMGRKKREKLRRSQDNFLRRVIGEIQREE